MPWKNTEMTVAAIAAKLGATVVGGDPMRVIRRILALNETGSDAISFYRTPASGKLPSPFPQCAALICSHDIASQISALPACQLACIVVKDPLNALVQITPLFFEPDGVAQGIHPTAVVDPSASISPLAAVGPLCVIGAGAQIADYVQLHPHVVIYPRVRIDRNVIIHAHAVIREDTILSENVVVQPGAVIGSDGFGYIPDATLGLRGVPQMGSVHLAAYVEVGANTCIDRATLGATTIGVGSKLDNLVQVGHNVEIGSHALLCGQVGVAGSAVIGNQVVLGGNSGVADHITIGDRIRVAAKAAVTRNISEPGDYGGYPAVPAQEWHRMVAAVKMLPDRLRKLTRKTNNEE